MLTLTKQDIYKIIKTSYENEANLKQCRQKFN